VVIITVIGRESSSAVVVSVKLADHHARAATATRLMGTSRQMIDRTDGHLAAGADGFERDLLDSFDERGRGMNGRYLGAEIEGEETS
jgi:hypothetical protein